MSVICIPLIPHFYIVKLGYAGVYLFFLFLLQGGEAVLTCTHNLCFEQNIKNVIFFRREVFNRSIDVSICFQYSVNHLT